ncbi:MAG: hypothetical protein Q4Q58_03015 [Thermoplasmata archaeon]|nr:hypothetical protein [Thermoplasmata archaeon]
MSSLMSSSSPHPVLAFFVSTPIPRDRMNSRMRSPSSSVSSRP